MMRTLVFRTVISCTLLAVLPGALGNGESEEQEILELASKLNRVSMDYSVTVSEKLLSEANDLAFHLRLAIPLPIKPSEARIWVSPPWFNKVENSNTNLSKVERIRSATFFATGTVNVGNYCFGLGNSRNRLHVQRVRFDQSETIVERFPQLAKSVSLIDTNGAYQLATQWLNSVKVDVSALENGHPLSMEQRWYDGKSQEYPVNGQFFPANSTNKTMLPIYDVTWGSGTKPAVKITVLGTTKELLEMQINEGSVLKRSPLIVTNAIELNSRPGPAPKKLSVEEPQDSSKPINNPPVRPAPFRRHLN
jgi:hypothetical protein